MAWTFVVVAGFFETIWVCAMKAGGLRTLPTAIIMLVAMAGSFLFLAAAMQTLPLGPAYSAWTGIGAVGAFAIGAFLYKEPLNVASVAGAVAILIGLLLIRCAAGETA